MADRSVNININYRVNTADIEKLNGAVSRADQATQRLRQSATQAGAQGARANQPYIRSIESVRQEMQRTRALIDVTARSDTKLLNERVRRYRQLKGEVDRFNKSVEGSGKAAKSSESSFLSLSNIVRTVFTVAIARQVATMALDMARLAGNVEGVDRGFRRAFPNAEILLRDLRRHTHGTINDFVLMQRTLQATNLGVAVEHLGVLFEFAATRAQQTGESVDYLVDSIVRGIGRKSVLVLDNLGISATRLKEEFDGAAIASQNVGDVTAAVARIAGEELDKMGGFAETSATKVDRLAASWEKFRQTVSRALDSGGVIDFVTEYVDALQTLIEANERGVSVSDVLADRESKRIAAYETEIFLTRNLTGEREKDIKFLEETIFATQKDILTRNNLIATQSEMVANMEEEISGMARTSQARIIQIAELQKDIDFRKKVIDELTSEKSHRQEWLTIYLQTLNALVKGNKVVDEQAEKVEDLNEKLREFQSPAVLERVGKIIDERIKAGFEDSTRELLNMEEVLERLSGAIVPIEIKPDIIRFATDWENLVDFVEENWRELASQGIDITSNFLQASVDAELESYRTRIEAVQQFYDEQILLAGDNERAKQQLRVEEERRIDELRRREAQKEKQARRFHIIIDTAAAIAKTAAQLGFPLAIPFIALAVANGVLQLAALNKAQPRGFFKGEVGIDGPGTSTSDSIPARLSRGESIINADATKRSFNLLEAVNSGKVDDRILQDIRGVSSHSTVQKVDLTPVVNAIREQPQTDVIRVGSTVYEAKIRRANFKRYVRSKSMSK